MFARVSSFAELAKIVQTGLAAAVLPLLATVDFDQREWRKGSITYYHKAKTRDWLNQNSGSNSLQYWIGHLGRRRNIRTDADIVKPEGWSLMSSPPNPASPSTTPLTQETPTRRG
jgi:hypothetical protein